ncbi:unnamed protein product [Didymodactylos carnosus]|uniref:Ras-related protein Rab-18 n=1 Tax=Didymodactylos carnosus TaxID=1234261 RepID=A0A816AP47_9BILA|nr:unnamed protein product [Didymodactylos carnosus]CAF4472853.1 unnamed protein product [Didymodactylos carnosus]
MPGARKSQSCSSLNILSDLSFNSTKNYSMADDDILTTLKILIIGESGVGKSSLLLRFTDDKFDPEQPATIGVDFKVKPLDVGGNRVKLAIWTACSRYAGSTPHFLQTDQAIPLQRKIIQSLKQRPAGPKKFGPGLVETTRF